MRPKLSVREAARRAAISEGWWRQVVRGYQPIRGGGKAPMQGSAETLARMAQVVGVMPEELEEAGRPDAAAELRQLRPNLTMDQVEALLDENERIAAELVERVRRMDTRKRQAVIDLVRAMDESNESTRDGSPRGR